MSANLLIAFLGAGAFFQVHSLENRVLAVSALNFQNSTLNTALAFQRFLFGGLRFIIGKKIELFGSGRDSL